MYFSSDTGCDIITIGVIEMDSDIEMNMLWRYAVAGNIKKSRIDENGILRYGTPAYKGNTKVYLCGRNWDERLPDPDKTHISVVELSRGGRYYVDYVPIELIENLRLTRVYTPGVLKIMSDPEFREYWWGNSQEDRADAAQFLKSFKEKYNK